MNDANIAHSYVPAQDVIETLFYDNGDVFCPMCEIRHENNTYCQATWSGC